jgi:hypothetical protein
MSAEDWELAKGHRCRILMTQDDTAWLFAVQTANSSIDDGIVERPTVQTCLSDEGLSAAQARRFGHALLKAAEQLDALLTTMIFSVGIIAAMWRAARKQDNKADDD